MEKLAIRGGKPSVTRKLPTYTDHTGRFIGEEELRHISEVIRSGSLSFLYGRKVRQLQEEFASLYGVDCRSN